ncbi:MULTISPECIES: hypothetical protein [unclassified Nostoc]|nr:hypothetical protein [Nostoc sp. DedQUE03]MDZ7975224.1 hypothetical protein [Nostoc sp. DedQUE03]
MADLVKFPDGDGNQESNIQKSQRESLAGFLSETHQRAQFLPNYFVS